MMTDAVSAVIDIQIGAIRPVLLPTLFQILLDLSPRHTKKRTHNQNVISQHPFRVHTAHSMHTASPRHLK